MFPLPYFKTYLFIYALAESAFAAAQITRPKKILLIKSARL